VSIARNLLFLLMQNFYAHGFAHGFYFEEKMILNNNKAK